MYSAISTSVCFYTEWSICPEQEDVTCRGSLFAHAFFGALPAVCSDRTFLGRYGFLCPMMTRFPYAGPSGQPLPLHTRFCMVPLWRGACGRGRADDLAGLTEALAGPAIFSTSCAGSFASSEGRGGPPANETVRGQTAEVLSHGHGTSLWSSCWWLLTRHDV
ncbi:hypothetical protein GGI43DRAFT_252570 [Trichoderma evansii]